MRRIRTSLGWGTGLIVYGLLLLMRSAEVTSPTVAVWPWALLAAGVGLLAYPPARREGSLVTPLVLTVVGGVFALRELGGLPGGVRSDVARQSNGQDVTLRQKSPDIDAGAAEVAVRVPDSVAADIRVHTALAGVDVDRGRFPRDGERFRSTGYDTAPHRAEIDLEGGVASFSVR